jgi:hypothetical protein
MAIANVQKELIQGGKQNLVGDMQLYNTAAELTRIMGHKNPDRFFNDPSAKDPRTGQLLHPPAPPPPDPKLLAVQARARADAQGAQSDAQLAQLKAQSDAQLAAFKAQLDQRMLLIEAALQERADARTAALQQQKAQHAQEAHAQDMAKGVLDIVATAQAHDAKIGRIKPQPVQTDE